MNLTELKHGQTAVIKEIQGGGGMVQKLDVMGIIPSARIEKVSDQFMHGPVTVRVGQTQVSIGYSMAQRIIVETDEA